MDGEMGIRFLSVPVALVARIVEEYLNAHELKERYRVTRLDLIDAYDPAGLVHVDLERVETPVATVQVVSLAEPVALPMNGNGANGHRPAETMVVGGGGGRGNFGRPQKDAAEVHAGAAGRDRATQRGRTQGASRCRADRNQ